MPAYGITLELVAAPGATPITPNAAAAKGFHNNYFKLAVPSLSNRDRKTISILGLIYELANAGGANYKTNHAGLRQDAVVFNGGIPKIDRIAADAANDWNAGFVADATLSTDVPTLIAAGPKIDATDEYTLDLIIIFLRAQLRR